MCVSRVESLCNCLCLAQFERNSNCVAASRWPAGELSFVWCQPQVVQIVLLCSFGGYCCCCAPVGFESASNESCGLEKNERGGGGGGKRVLCMLSVLQTRALLLCWR